ncbi:hypothetical protein [Cytobacillus sp. IB215665]|uniref:hypothetical protein n=1 Tax=Cytobacillus sp. IB215665 TaxID=3097357 RepID=UPI002A13F699|nr:hypothetical protein [Cytobacillus sp. IB215665]MDX8365828.1 hypothetical protein [Cytobacillus sp. IB215665]
MIKQLWGLYNFIIFLFTTTIVLGIFFESFLAVYANKVSSFLSVITILTLVLYIYISYKLASKLYFGVWRYLLYIPLLNVILYIGTIPYYLLLRNAYNYVDEGDYGMGLTLLPLSITMWLIFICATFKGMLNRKKIHNN